MQAILLTFLMSVLSYADQPFWYAGDEKVELWIDSTLLLVKFDKPVSDTELNAFVASVGNIDSIVRDEWQSVYFVMCALKTSDNYDTFRLTDTRPHPDVRSKPRWYRPASLQFHLTTSRKISTFVV